MVDTGILLGTLDVICYQTEACLGLLTLIAIMGNVLVMPSKHHESMGTELVEVSCLLEMLTHKYYATD